jgi:fructokinase
MEKEYDVVALGELLVDMIGTGESGYGNPVFEANPGGAPCNVLAILQKLGRKTAFIGKVGRDMFGKRLRSEIVSCGIDDKGLLEDETVPTTLAFVHKLENGDRDFSFYRSPGADVMLKEEEVDLSLIRSSRIFHFGSLSLTDEPSRSATRRAIEEAEKAGILRSYDPNLRMPLWHSEEEAKEQILWGMKHCDILKIADNEILWLTGGKEYDDAIRILQKEYAIPLIALTLGAEGSRIYCRNERICIPAFLQKTIDTTGAGDTYCGCLLNGILEHGLNELDEETICSFGTFASAAAAIVTTRKGALKSMPDVDSIRILVNKSRD